MVSVSILQACTMWVSMLPFSHYAQMPGDLAAEGAVPSTNVPRTAVLSSKLPRPLAQ